MQTNTGGGLFAGIGRAFGGGSLFITDYTSEAAGAQHLVCPEISRQHSSFQARGGRIDPLPQADVSLREKSVTFDIAFQQRLGAGFFGGEGFIIQRVTGPGMVWLDPSGEVVS